MPSFTYTLSGTITVPEGATLNATKTGIILSDGNTLKLWEAAEIIDKNEDTRDLSHDECIDMDIDYDGDMTRFEEV